MAPSSYALPVDTTDDDQIETLAAAWLELERRAVAEPTDERARLAAEASDRFERAIREASPEDLRLAWEAARKTQASVLMGSVEWAEARSVSQLLRVEYLAAQEA